MVRSYRFNASTYPGRVTLLERDTKEYDIQKPEADAFYGAVFDNTEHCNIVKSLMDIFGICSWQEQTERQGEKADGNEMLVDVGRNSQAIWSPLWQQF